MKSEEIKEKINKTFQDIKEKKIFWQRIESIELEISKRRIKIIISTDNVNFIKQTD